MCKSSCFSKEHIEHSYTQMWSSLPLCIDIHIAICPLHSSHQCHTSYWKMRQSFSLDLESYHYYVSYLACFHSTGGLTSLFICMMRFSLLVFIWFAKSNLVFFFCPFVLLVLYYLEQAWITVLCGCNPNGVQCFPPLLFLVHFLHHLKISQNLFKHTVECLRFVKSTPERTFSLCCSWY